MLRIRLAKSPVGNTARNRATVKALGLRKVHQVVNHDDSPTIRGMIHRVKHLLVVETVEGEVSKKKETSRAKPTATAAAPKPSPKPEKVEKAAETPAPKAAAKEKTPAKAAAAKPKAKAAPKAPKAKE